MIAERKHQRGVAIAVVAVFLLVICAFTALGIDIARLAFTATEVQSVADAAARGGAKELSDVGGTPNAGITRAREIADLNFMNGETASDASEVLVDEGFFDFDNRQFKCCTTNSPCCQGSSTMDGWSCTGSGTADCSTRSAVLALPHTTVTNIFAGIFDGIANGHWTPPTGSANKTTRVDKVAVAAAAGPTSACQVPAGCNSNDWACYCAHGVAPCLPIAAPTCQFPAGCTGASCQLPDLEVSSSGSDSAAWTGFNEGSDDNTIRKFISQGTCDPPGANGVVPQQTIGPNINLNNGISGGHAWDMAECIWRENKGCNIDGDGKITAGPGRVFTIPIFDLEPCSTSMNQARKLVGFATIRIDNVDNLTNDGDGRTIEITTLANSTNSNEQLGGGCFGTKCQVVLAR